MFRFKNLSVCLILENSTAVCLHTTTNTALNCKPLDCDPLLHMSTSPCRLLNRYSFDPDRRSTCMLWKTITSGHSYMTYTIMTSLQRRSCATISTTWTVCGWKPLTWNVAQWVRLLLKVLLLMICCIQSIGLCWQARKQSLSGRWRKSWSLWRLCVSITCRRKCELLRDSALNTTKTLCVMFVNRWAHYMHYMQYSLVSIACRTQ